MTSEHRLLVLGLGNVLCADDGVGVAAVERLQDRWIAPPDVAVLDGGTLGLALLPYLEAAEAAILLDAVAADAAPGTLVRLEGDEVAPAVRDRLSVHQIGVADLLDGARLRDRLPRRLVLLGLVPESVEHLRIGLSPAVATGLDALVAAAVRTAGELGHCLRRRRASDADHRPASSFFG